MMRTWMGCATERELVVEMVKDCRGRGRETVVPIARLNKGRGPLRPTASLLDFQRTSDGGPARHHQHGSRRRPRLMLAQLSRSTCRRPPPPLRSRPRPVASVLLLAPRYQLDRDRDRGLGKMASSAGLRRKASQKALNGEASDVPSGAPAPATNGINGTRSLSSSAAASHSHHHGHSHGHGHHGHSHGGEEETEALANALKGGSDPGSRITLIGLAANVDPSFPLLPGPSELTLSAAWQQVVLTGTKGAAGYFLSSASLIADAGHSLSDLLGDFVTLFCWKLARRAPSERYPYGYGASSSLWLAGTRLTFQHLVRARKVRVVGVLDCFLLPPWRCPRNRYLVLALALVNEISLTLLCAGIHSYSLLITVLSTAASSPETVSEPTATILSSLPAQTVLHNASSLAHTLSSYLPTHDHSSDALVDARAAWFALLSVVVKEWLYRITIKVGKDLNSGVLIANAIHHRSDAFSSVVALLAIVRRHFSFHLVL